MVATFAFCFVFVSFYVPQPFNKINEAEAGGGLTGEATEWTQIGNNVLLGEGNISASASAASNAVTAAASNSLWIKENILDGIAWTLAKAVISQMTGSIVSWINSGFEGSPAFVQDLSGFLTNVADKTIGSYIQELGGPLSFICSPFQLDVRIALTATYARTRDGQPSAPTCTLSGALANIENFIDGSFEQGGWDAWFMVATKPETYTPYGNLLTAESQASIRILNAKGEETKLLDFGGGFLSSKICETVHGSGTTKENCFISTPGKVIQETLNTHLSSGKDSLIAADEFNEIIVALFAQLSEQVVTGAAGLLGLSSGTGYTYPGFTGGSYVEAAAANTIDPSRLGTMLNSALSTETRYRTAAQTYLPILTAYAANILNDARRRDGAAAAANRIPALLVVLNNNITTLTNLRNQFTALGPNPNSDQLQPIFDGYTSLTLHQDPEVDAAIANWASLVN
jgi:hypothetical protein